MVAGAAHLGEHLVQPLEGAVQVDLNPAGGGGDVLPVVLRPPALHEGHPGTGGTRGSVVSPVACLVVLEKVPSEGS